MGRVGAFLKLGRKANGMRPAEERVCDYDEITVTLGNEERCDQASRCMNCGVAFCQSGIALSSGHRVVGCPLQNLIPETNDLLFRRRWDDAAGRLFLTNPFPEFTGRVCPSPCEQACNLGLNEDAVTIHDNERALADYAWERGIDPLPVPSPEAPLVSVVGSGPAGLACAWELARRGIRVQVVERADRPGGLLMYGIPAMKLPKEVVDRRIALMEASGIGFSCGVDAAVSAEGIIQRSDAVVLAAGAALARDMPLPGRDLLGVHLALEYLSETTKALLEHRDPSITAQGKDVVVIGGGDTGVDCVACALRQGAASVTQVIRAQRPSDTCNAAAAWPGPRPVYSQGYGQSEAQELFGDDPRLWATDTLAFSGDGAVEAVEVCDLSYDGGRHIVSGSERQIPAQLVLIAKGFLGAEPGLFEAFGVEAAQADGPSHRLPAAFGSDSGAPPIFAAGDARLGSTLVATAMADGLACADEVAALL